MTRPRLGVWNGHHITANKWPGLKVNVVENNNQHVFKVLVASLFLACLAAGGNLVEIGKSVVCGMSFQRLFLMPANADHLQYIWDTVKEFATKYNFIICTLNNLY